MPYKVQYFNHITQNQPLKKKKSKEKKNAVPTDPKDIAIEFLKVEISTLQAKLQKQETELKDLRFRNGILMDRNKMLEEAKKSEIHEKYFPSQSASATDPQPAGRNHPGREQHHDHACCGPHVIHNHYGQPTGPQQSSFSDIVTVDTKLTDLSKSVQDLQQLIGRLQESANTPGPPPTDSSGPISETAPPAQGTVPSAPGPATKPASVSTATPTAEPSEQAETETEENIAFPEQSTEIINDSTISLDGFMFDDDITEMDLN